MYICFILKTLANKRNKTNVAYYYLFTIFIKKWALKRLLLTLMQSLTDG